MELLLKAHRWAIFIYRQEGSFLVELRWHGTEKENYTF